MRWLDRLRPRKPAANPDHMAVALSCAKAGDYAAALAIWEPLAQAGFSRAQNNIGACFAEGLGVTVDLNLARRWLQLAAEAGDPVGQRNYAALHMREADADFEIAADFYRRAAEQGDAPSQDMLSWMLLEGSVMNADPVEARHWAEQAASAGIASSMTRLGMLYHNARGVRRDPEMAARWWGRGARNGDADAQAMLGAALHMGSGIEPDGVCALAWLIRAEMGGSDLAKPFLEVVRSSLSAEEIGEAEQRAAGPISGEMR
ncbi:tetratricopeptide repeat protein [Rhizobium grahamii]|uniref:Sel1 repeat family protein n=1 Tax=Rhizobium grahamii TaxID=1120045 RepID=A0A370KGR1_9HYPH|nr:tetratricopeptide repeat protein [Rhizobium grahamii]RDJ03921.1 hypothetical protein B5K06_28855 [Rhizobium grahamii]